MNITEIYKGQNLLFPLTDDEYLYVDMVWKFIENFRLGHITIYEYRNKMINYVKENFDINEFYVLEIIAEKLYWNLKNIFKNNNRNNDQIEEFYFWEIPKLIDRLKSDNYYRSFINKIINIDFSAKKFYYKKMEGSCHLFFRCDINEYISSIYFDRILYESTMQDNTIRNKVINSLTFYQLDYGFPNLNICKPFIYNENNRKKRIKYMYFEDNSEANWSKLFEFESII